MKKDVIFQIEEGGVGVLTLNRERQHHALSQNLLLELSQCLEEIKQHPLRVLLLTSTGMKSFCAGADLKERLGMNEEETRIAVGHIRKVMNEVARLEIPTVAGLNGSAFGGGLELALACDIRVGVEESTVGLTETSLGIIPGAGGTQRLSRLVGIGRAKELIFTARKISAEEAYEYGILQFLYPRVAFQEKLMDLCQQIASRGPLAQKAAKMAIQSGYDLPLEKGLYLEQLGYESILYSEDRKEGLRAFSEKRKPVYKGG